MMATHVVVVVVVVVIARVVFEKWGFVPNVVIRDDTSIG